MKVKRFLVLPHLFYVDEPGIENIFGIRVFFTAILGSTALGHTSHGETGIGKVLGREANCSYDQQHRYIVCQLRSKHPMGLFSGNRGHHSDLWVNSSAIWSDAQKH